MTVETSTSRVQYATNGTTGPWSVPFYFLADADLRVVYADSTGAETELVLTTDYSVTGAANPAGGAVSTVASYGSGGTITVVRELEALQPTDYADTDAFPAASLERNLDRLTMLAQQQAEVSARSIVLPVSDESSVTIPSAAERASKLFAFDASGDLALVAPTSGDATDLALDLSSSSVAAKGAALLGYSPAIAYGAGIGQFLNYTFGRTAAEIAASVTPTAYQYRPGDVRRYGAVADGTTNDKAAVQAAMDQFGYGGAPVYLPGMCYIASRLEYGYTRGLHMYGDGWRSGLKGAAAGTYILLLIQHAIYAAIDNVRLSNFAVDGNNGGQLDAGLFQLNNCQNFVVEHLKIGNTTRASGSSGVNGIALSEGSTGGAGPSGVIRSSYIYSTSKAGINATSGCLAVIVDGNSVADCTGNGQAPGIQINGAAGTRVTNNRVTGTQGIGIMVNVDGAGNQPLDTIISGNIVNGCGATSTVEGDGIRVTAGTTYAGRVIVANNSISTCGTASNGGSGIYGVNTKNLVLTGNICRDSAYDGIRVQGCDYLTIDGNRTTGNNRAAVSYAGGVQILGTCGEVSITGNNTADDKGTKTQSYGIITDSGAVITSLTIEGNHLGGNANGPLLLQAGAKNMRLVFVAEKQTTDGTAQTAQYITLPDTSALAMTARAIGKKSDASERAIYTREGLFYRNGGSATQQGATTTLGSDIESDATWTGLTMGVSGNLALIQVTGKAATTIDWRITVMAQTV